MSHSIDILEKMDNFHYSLSLTDLWALIKEDWHCHKRDWTLPGFRAVAVCRFGQWRMSIRNPLIRKPLSIFYRMLYRRVRNVYGIELPYTVELGRRVLIEHQGGIVVHGYVSIGDDCILRQGITLGNRYLEKPRDCPQLANKVNVGAGAQLLGNIHVGEGVSIGANSVVIHDVMPHSTVVGIPAKPISSKTTD